MSSNKKLRILCLHGFYQNADVFRMKTGSFRKYFKKYADFEFVNAPHVVVEDVFADRSATEATAKLPSTTSSITTATVSTNTTTPITTTTNTTTSTQNTIHESNIESNEEAQSSTGVSHKQEAQSVASKNEDGEPGVDTGPHLAWWHTVSSWLTTPVYPGVDESMHIVEKFIQEKGPFDGLLGFSQGGVFAAILSNKNQFNFKFVIICSAFVPSVPTFCLGEQFNTIPSLHFYGRNDSLVSPAYGKKLASMFHDSISFEHKGGHFVPTDADSKKNFKEFFERFYKE